MLRTVLLLWVVLLTVSCTKKTFKKLDAGKTGIRFNNVITENDSINIFDLEYVYNGGGVAISDFNNDGQQDVFFTGNQVGNKLYLNKGNLEFDDVTAASKVAAIDRWNTGVAAVDINSDGWMDLYVCASIKKDPAKRANRLFINKGVNSKGVPVFIDESAAYGVADTGYTTNAAFFDYDNDGDLDLYVLTNKMAQGDIYPNQYKRKITDGTAPTTDRLYRNDWDSGVKHPVFTDVSSQAGITIEGYGLGLSVADINKDGWKDIYVTNDFLSNDLLWINNRNGTFTNKAGEYFKHTSYSAMGNDVVDINNDGLPDVIAVDMLPATNTRKKMMMSANSYQTYANNDEYGYEYQYGRNTLQLNMGSQALENDSARRPIFGDIAFYAGVAETDWSWTPLVTDFDNDGFRDIIITNGFPKDITDHDFMTYRVNAKSIAPKDELLGQIPMVKLNNHAFRNNKDLSFTNVVEEWGMSEPSFSSGAAYGDLDNDGDLDVVVSNINHEAFVYENRSANSKKNHFLQLTFKGDGPNRNGIGAWAEIYYNGQTQVYENTPYRGYLSTVQPLAHFGLGTATTVDSVLIKWPGGKLQVLKNVKANQVITADIRNANETFSFDHAPVYGNVLFTDVTSNAGVHLQQPETDFPDFNIQKLLPHKLSEYGPALAVGDVDNNGLDDVICGGSFSYSTVLLLQQADGTFVEKKLVENANHNTKPTEDMGLLLFDAEGDGDLDLYIASGGYENSPNSNSYQDQFYVNDGKGNFSKDSTALPQNVTSKSCVRAADYDKDGDLDLFVAGRVEPWSYPKPVSSFIYRNDSKDGRILFADVTKTVAKELVDIGLTCDAVWTDFDNDGWLDLLLAGEWMHVMFLKNNNGIFKDVSGASGIGNHTGWWNSIAPGDFDNDGDIDYIMGNVGRNTLYQANEKQPAKIYAKDFNNDGNYDAIPSLFLNDGQGGKKEYPVQTRDDLVKQMISMRAKFQTYSSFANATMDKLFSSEELKDALILEANTFESVLLLNAGQGKFEIKPLPAAAQLSMINGMVVEDFDGDGNIDVAMNTNDYGTEVSVGRYDALNGLFLKGDGMGNFNAASISQSGLYIPGNGKAMAKGLRAGNRPFLAASQNRGLLKLFEWKGSFNTFPVQKTDVNAMVRYRNGKMQKQEFYYGASFLSQSGRFLLATDSVHSIEISDFRGNKRHLSVNK
jgi:hypothetical protein